MDARRDDIPTIFAILDADDSGDVNTVEFVDQLDRMKTQNTHTMLVFLQHSIKQVRDSVQDALAVQAKNHEQQMERIRSDVQTSHKSNDPSGTPRSEPTDAAADAATFPHLLPRLHSGLRANVQNEAYVAIPSAGSDTGGKLADGALTWEALPPSKILLVKDADIEMALTSGRSVSESIDDLTRSSGFCVRPPRTSPAPFDVSPAQAHKKKHTHPDNYSFFADRLVHAQQHVFPRTSACGLPVRCTEIRSVAETNLATGSHIVDA